MISKRSLFEKVTFLVHVKSYFFILSFQLLEAELPEGFLRADLHLEDDNARHLIFATDVMLGLLKNAKTW